MTIETENYIIETPDMYFEISTDAGKIALLGWLEKLKEQNKEYICMLKDGTVLLKKIYSNIELNENETVL